MRYELLGVASASAGVLSHLIYFIHGHKAMQAPRIFVFYLMSECLLWVRCFYLQGAFQGTLSATTISLSYFLGLFASIAVYRLFFHRLRRFPGPLAAKLTKFYGPYKARGGKSHINFVGLFEKYGDVVRIAPNELIVLSTDAQQKVFGAGTRCSKENTAYESVTYKGFQNLEAATNREEHRKRRQIWDKAFSTKALQSYETYARETVYEWLGKLASLQGQPVNTSLYSLLIAFENMGRMGFSINFGSIQKGKEDIMLHYLEETLSMIAKLGTMWWPIALVSAIGGSGDHIEFEKLACKMVDQREKQSDDENEDIMKYILQDHHAKVPKGFHHHDLLYADAQVIMVAGTDTIGAALSFAFYHLARDPAIRQKLLVELEPLYGRTLTGEFTNHDLSDTEAPYLNALINETMRLDNPTCSNGGRLTPPEGLEVDGIYIPGEVVVTTPTHAIQRSAKYFKDPDNFIPERWTTRPDLIIDRRAYLPFSLGSHSCVGKRVALLVIRMCLAYTVWYYDFQFAPGEDGLAIHRDSIDASILKPGKLECVFTQRT